MNNISETNIRPILLLKVPQKWSYEDVMSNIGDFHKSDDFKHYLILTTLADVENVETEMLNPIHQINYPKPIFVVTIPTRRWDAMVSLSESKSNSEITLHFLRNITPIEELCKEYHVLWKLSNTQDEVHYDVLNPIKITFNEVTPDK